MMSAARQQFIHKISYIFGFSVIVKCLWYSSKVTKSSFAWFLFKRQHCFEIIIMAILCEGLLNMCLHFNFTYSRRTTNIFLKDFGYSTVRHHETLKELTFIKQWRVINGSLYVQNMRSASLKYNVQTYVKYSELFLETDSGSFER